ncbi:MAG TPA: AAA family ATPase [Segeticoccus sp.]|nr:AAA family ATPase [Segeticoccus sp.]
MSSDDQPGRPPVLVVVGGLPATGKTTVGRAVARGLCAAYLRIDTIETAIARSEGRFRESNDWELPPGYVTGYDLATDQLRLGLDVVAESVNPLPETRDAWRDAGLRAGAHVVEVEVVCSDPAEHRRRAEERVLDIADLTKPTWDQVTQREYHPWGREHLVIDTAVLDADEGADRVRAAVDAAPASH